MPASPKWRMVARKCSNSSSRPGSPRRTFIQKAWGTLIDSRRRPKPSIHSRRRTRSAASQRRSPGTRVGAWMTTPEQPIWAAKRRWSSVASEGMPMATRMVSDTGRLLSIRGSRARRQPGKAWEPPSTRKTWPLTYEAASEARKATAAAISAGRP